MAEPRYLVDTSVFLRSDMDEVADRLLKLMYAGKVWTCRVVDLELIYSARQRDVAAVAAQRLKVPVAVITPEITDRALAVAQLMSEQGVHRGAKVTDLLIAAAAEARGLSVLHYDADFERIASVTGQPTEWVAPKGSLDH